MMLAVGATDSLDTLHRILVADMATECVTRVGGINHQTTAIDDGNGLLNQTLLGIVRMDFKKLRHNEFEKARSAIIQEFIGNKTTIIIILQINQLERIADKLGRESH